MTPWYARNPWNLVLAFGFLGAALVSIAFHTSLWVIPGLAALVILVKLRQWLVRLLALRRHGYFAGRQIRESWVYEELHGNEAVVLSLPMQNIEPGHWALFVPGDAEWRTVVPGWAHDRKKEILQRIAERLPLGDIHYD